MSFGFGGGGERGDHLLDQPACAAGCLRWADQERDGWMLRIDWRLAAPLPSPKSGGLILLCAGFGAGSSPFGTTSPSPFGQQPAPAFGQSTSPFGATTTTGVFGQVGSNTAVWRVLLA